MSGVIPRFETGPVTYPAIAAVTGGRLVEAFTGGVRHASAGSTAVLGVATKDASPTASAETTDAQGRTVLNVYADTNQVAVGSRGYWLLEYAAVCTFGAHVKAAADGKVVPWVTGTDNPSLIVGKCTEVTGAVSGGKALTKINV